MSKNKVILSKDVQHSLKTVEFHFGSHALQYFLNGFNFYITHITYLFKNKSYFNGLISETTHIFS